MNAFAASALAVAGGLVGVALGDLLSEEIRARLEKVPHAILRLAALRVAVSLRRELHGEWSAELTEILRGRESLPVTRLWVGLRFALGLLRSSPEVDRVLTHVADDSEHDGERSRVLPDRPDPATAAALLSPVRLTGRRLALEDIGTFIRARRPTEAMLLLTGSPGAGKSSVLARLVGTTAIDAPATAGPGALVVHASGKAAHQVGREIAQAVGIRMPIRLEDLARRLRDELRRTGAGTRALVIDGLDEAERPTEVLHRVLVPVAESCSGVGLRMVVGTRRFVLGTLGFGRVAASVVDLDSERYSNGDDLRTFAHAVLREQDCGLFETPGGDDRTARIAERIAHEAAGNYLIAALMARTAAMALVQDDPDFLWVSPSVSAAVQAYLNVLPDGGVLGARAILEALAGAGRSGLTLRQWRAALASRHTDAPSMEQLLEFARTPSVEALVIADHGRSDTVFRFTHDAVLDTLHLLAERTTTLNDDRPGSTGGTR